MPASALLLAASAAVRAASLNLCSDEYLLLLARPEEVTSVSFLARDPLESPLWQRAQGHPANRGSIEDVLAARPSLVLTMGGGGRSSGALGRRVGIRTIDLAPTRSLDDVAANLRAVAAALGRPERATPWLKRLAALRQAPERTRDAIWLTAGGDSLAPGSAGAQWLRLAGLRQRPLVGGRVTLEILLSNPPQVLVESRYRRTQVSRGTRWLDHPIVRNVPSRRIQTDGRAWTCMGPLLIPEIERLRKAAS